MRSRSSPIWPKGTPASHGSRSRTTGTGAARTRRCIAALELAPGNAIVLHQAGIVAGINGRFEDGIALGRCAIEQDPLSPSAHFYQGMTLHAAGRSGEAVTAVERALELAPQSAAMHACLAVVLVVDGRLAQAREHMRQEPEEWGRLFARGVVEKAAGREAESLAALRELASKYAGDAAYQVAEIHAFRGEADSAFEWLARARMQHDAGIAWTKIDPLLRALHADAHWGGFVQEIGLAE